MKKSLKIIIYLIVLLIIVGLSVFLYSKKLYGYFLISLGFILVFSLLLILTMTKKTDEDSVYDSTLKTIRKRYDSILVETSTIPDFEGKNVMMIVNIEDMIDASVEIRKPIYYKIEENYTTFILLDNQDISIYILKKESNVDTPIERLIKEKKDDIEDLINQAKDSKNANNKENNEVVNGVVDNNTPDTGVAFESNNVIENSNNVEQPIEITPVTSIEENNTSKEVKSVEVEQKEETVEENTSSNEEPQLIPQNNVVEEDNSDTEEEIL